MTEVDWLAGTDPMPMLGLIRGNADDRKLRLFAVACCRRVEHLFDDIGDHDVLGILERYVDRQAKPAELALIANQMTNLAVRGAAAMSAGQAAVIASAACVDVVAAAAGGFDHPKSQGDSYAAEAGARRVQCRLLRDVFGNPFQPVAFDPEWRTSTAVALAKLMYESRDFSAMPILADALQDAGCENTGVLNHCRGPEAHVRGCWVVDLVLGKA
jgi:hypothetical protein